MSHQTLVPLGGEIEAGPEQPSAFAHARWATDESPLGFAAGDANLYRYVGNSPTNATDPSGLDVYGVPWEGPPPPPPPPPAWQAPYNANPAAQAAFDRLWDFVYSQNQSVAWSDPCFVWAGQVNTSVPFEFWRDPGPIRVELVYFSVTGAWLVEAHAAFQVTFPDGSVIYFDEGGPYSSWAGALGGTDRWFGPNEIPSNYTQVP